MRNISHTKTSSADGLAAVGKGLHEFIKDKDGNDISNPKYKVYHDHLTTLQNAYKEYDGLTKPCVLETLSKLGLAKGDQDAIKELYSRERKCIDDLWQEVAYVDGVCVMCPLCGQKPVTDLDHYVPRAKMPEYSVHLLNLIPTCHECNMDKDEQWLDDKGKRLIFNAYFDCLADVSGLLNCNLEINSSSDIPQVSLSLNNAAVKASGEVGRLVESTYMNVENVRKTWRKKASETLKNKVNEILRTINVYKRRGKYIDDNEAWDIQKEVLQETIDSLQPFEFIEKIVYQTMISSTALKTWLLSKISTDNSMKPKNEFVVRLTCESCGDVFSLDLEDYDLSWEIVESDERGMGAEIHHQAIVYEECPECESEITITLDAWEYPMGIFNTSSIEIEGATLVGKACSLDGLAPIGDVEFEEEIEYDE